MTLGEWLGTWLELYVDPAKLAENTKKCYHRAVRAVPCELSSIQLEQLSAIDVRRWLLQVARETPRAAQLDRVVLGRALKIAGKLRLCPAGLLDADTCPQIDHTARKAVVLNSDQMRAYMAAARTSCCAPVLLFCCIGLRRGEAWGVRWEDIDLRAGTVAVVGQRIGSRKVPLKSKASRRVLALPPLILNVLRRWPVNLSGWVCDCPLHVVYREHAAIVEGLLLPAVTLHGLRHSFATLAAMSGEPMKLLQGALGHAKFQLTADLYADHLPVISAVSSRIFGAGHDWKSCVG